MCLKIMHAILVEPWDCQLFTVDLLITTELV